MKKIVLVLLVGLWCGCAQKRMSEKTGLEGKPMPAFNLLLPDSTTYFNTGDIVQGKPIVLFYFSPECPYCRAQMTEIVEKMPSLKDIRFYVFTTWPFNEMKKFYLKYHLDRYPNIIVGRDYENRFAAIYQPKSIPYIAIYGREKKLTAAFSGSIAIAQMEEVSKL